MKTRLLYFCSDYIVGLTQALTEQVEYLSKEDSIDLFCISSENEQEKGLHDRIRATKVNMSIVKGLDEHSNFKMLAKSIKEIIKTNGITHVNVHNNWQLALLSYLKISTRLKFKLIYTIHGYRHNHPIKAIAAIGCIGGALLLFADRVISMSGYVSKRFWFIKYKTDLVFYMMNKPEYFKTKNQIDTSKLSMVFPAQFREGKRQEILIEAVQKYLARTNDHTVTLHLPGDGPLLDSMKQLAKKWDIADNIKFYGKIPLDRVISLYENCNIALCSSNVETYGRCIAEPFMLGRCLITQRTGVAEDIIRNNENGFFFKDASELSEIMEYLHNNPDRIKDIADKAFADREIFFPKNVMKKYISSIYKA